MHSRLVLVLVLLWHLPGPPITMGYSEDEVGQEVVVERKVEEEEKEAEAPVPVQGQVAEEGGEEEEGKQEEGKQEAGEDGEHEELVRKQQEAVQVDEQADKIKVIAGDIMGLTIHLWGVLTLWSIHPPHFHPLPYFTLLSSPLPPPSLPSSICICCS